MYTPLGFGFVAYTFGGCWEGSAKSWGRDRFKFVACLGRLVLLGGVYVYHYMFYLGEVLFYGVVYAFGD